MVQISKHLFDVACRDASCYQMLHPWNESCLKAIPSLFLASTIGSAKFYAVVYAAQIAMRGKKMLKKEEWMKMGSYYVRSTMLGLLVTGTAPSISCLFRKIFGDKFHYYGYLWAPFTLTGVFIYLEPPSRRGLVINLFCNLFIEYWLKNLKHAGYLSITKIQQTFMFMVGSSLLFYLMRLEGERKERTPLFWLYTPEKVRRKDESINVCPHNGPCEKYIARGYATYFGVGLGITLARLIIPQIRSPLKAISSIRSKHLKLALFFGSYIGIYRAVICYLCRKKGYDSALYALPAGYLAGLSFLFSPTLGLSIASVTAAFKLYSTILYEKKVLPTSIPLPELLFCICQGTLFNARILHPETCPTYVHNLMRTISNGRSEWISDNVTAIIKKAL